MNSLPSLPLRELCDTELQKLALTVSGLSLGILVIGEDTVSHTYAKLKKKAGQRYNISVEVYSVASSASMQEIQEQFALALQNSGVIIQLPIHESFQKFVQSIPASKDVDLLGFGREELWSKGLLPPTIGAIHTTLGWLENPSSESVFQPEISLTGKTVVVIGQGKLVGGPMAQYVLRRGATLISINKDTKEPEKLSRMGDIIICGAGKPNLITPDWVRDETVIVIDAATSESHGKLVGDINYSLDFGSTRIVPSPGGIGPLTVRHLFYNLLKLPVI